ncbi:CpsD/CapB family tyrosine-protein kinase [candidate division KSB1 bacterium]|nr:CpsD/CapB family tyrosine-protein kinase [candidate division KSB1 bacterium]
MNDKEMLPFDANRDSPSSVPSYAKSTGVSQPRPTSEVPRNGAELDTPRDISNRLVPELTREQLRLRNPLLLANEQLGVRSVLITGASQGVGVTSVAITLALGLSMDHKKEVLLIDANVGRPQLHNLLNLTPSNNLTVASMAGAGFLDMAVVNGIPNLHVMSSGDVLRGATFNLKRFAAVLPALREAFDFMIVDASPVSHNFDVLMLSLHLDSVILVAEANRTRFQEVRDALKELKRAGTNLLGIVLNRQKEDMPRAMQNWL